MRGLSRICGNAQARTLRVAQTFLSAVSQRFAACVASPFYTRPGIAQSLPTKSAMRQTGMSALRILGTLNRRGTAAWTLVEMVGTLAVITILAGLLFPLLVRRTDKIVADQEVATLKSFRDALQSYILATRVIPDETTWNSAIAAKLGFGPNDVLYNVRQQSHQQSRVFLIDPALQMGQPATPTGLPYSQTNFYVASATAPTPMLPANPRVMIVSSLGRALPTNVVSGKFGNTTTQPYFANLWNAQDGTVPSDGAWTGWTGNSADVIVQRINLGPLFVHLMLSRYNSTDGGWFAIDANDGTTTPLQVITSVDGYFIQGSVLSLYTNNTGLDTKQILTADGSFVFEQGLWRGTLTGAALGNGAANASDVVQHFLDATPNTNAQNWSLTTSNAQQVLVVSNMLAYMSNYNRWAYTNLPAFSDNNLRNYLRSLEANSLMPALWGLYVYNYSNNGCCYPANPFPCGPQ
jgi:type II secretory pathway pseudopilin PulG